MLSFLVIAIPSWATEPNWIEFATFGTLIILGVWQYVRYRFGSDYSATRMWKLGFDTLGGEWPPAPAIGRGQGKTLEAKLETISGSDNSLRQGQIRVRVKAKRGVSVSEIDVRFVVKERHLKLWPSWESISLWSWKPINSVSIEKLTDAHAERFREELGSNDYPTERFSGVGKVLRYSNPKTLLAGDSFWLLLDVQGRESWSGYLEFCGPTPDGVRGYSRSKITVLVPKTPIPDKEGFPTE